MIIKQGFFTHYKTMRLRQRAGSSGVEALLQLWMHAEQSRTWKFPDWTEREITDVCYLYSGTENLPKLLVETGFLERLPRRGFVLHDWDTHNQQLIAAWSNAKYGKLGGRPTRINAANFTNHTGTIRVPDGTPSLNPSQPNPTQHKGLDDVSTSLPLEPAVPPTMDGLKNLASGIGRIGRTDGQPTPDAGQLSAYLAHDPRFAAMPRPIAKRCVSGWLKTVGKNGRSRDGELVVDMLASFRSYAEAAWANARKTS